MQCLVISSVGLFATPLTVAHQAPLSMETLQARILEWVAMPSSIVMGVLSCALYYFSTQLPNRGFLLKMIMWPCFQSPFRFSPVHSSNITFIAKFSGQISSLTGVASCCF